MVVDVDCWKVSIQRQGAFKCYVGKIIAEQALGLMHEPMFGQLLAGGPISRHR